MKLSCTPISCSASFRAETMSVERYFQMLAAAGCEGTDLLDSRCYPWFWKNGFQSDRKEVCRALSGAGLAAAAYACGNNFARIAETDFSDAVETVKNALREAAEIQAPCLRIFGGYHPECGGDKDITYGNGLEKIVRGIEECLPEAEKAGVILAIENHGRLPGLAEEMRFLTDHFHSPFLRLTFDAANFLANNMNEYQDPLSSYEQLKEFIVHIHVKDWSNGVPGNGRKRIASVAGEGGVVPLRQLFYRLKKDGYSGFVSLEYEAGSTVPEEEGVPRSLRYLNELRAAADFIGGEK